jgi:hypothetical protein
MVGQSELRLGEGGLLSSPHGPLHVSYAFSEHGGCVLRMSVSQEIEPQESCIAFCHTVLVIRQCHCYHSLARKILRGGDIDSFFFHLHITFIIV